MDDRLNNAVATPVDRLLDAVRAIDGARSLTAVLETVIARAAAEASRAGALLVRADHVRDWHAPGHLDLPLAETGFVADSVRTGFPASTTAAAVASPPFAGAAAGAELHAFPLALSGVVVAVLYAEGGNAATLEILARHAARALEALTAFKTARAVETPAADDEEAAALMDVSAA